MADDRGDQRSDNDNPAHGKASEDDGMRGQPIGGSDSNTGSGTTLTQGADFPAETANSNAQAQESNSSNSSGEGFIGSGQAGIEGEPINDEDEAEE